MTTELEREILKVLDANNFGLSVYAKPGADGISRAEIMDSLPTSIGPAGELAAEEVARTMGLSREEQEAEMRAQVPGIKGMATGAAVATATTIPDIIGLGYGGVKALLAKEGEKGQAFLDGLSSISGTVGSEKAGKIYAEYVGDLDATDEEKAAMMAGYQAGEFGGIPGLAGAYQLVKKGVKAAPDIIEGAGDAAKARMSESGTTLTSGVNPDPLIAAAGDAVAKFRAPTEKQPGVIAFHGSSADFDEFKLEKIGTGEGAQAYGYGLYFTDSEDIARFYRDTISRRQGGIPQSVPDNPENVAENLALDINFNEGVFGDTKQLQINSASPDYDFYIQTLDDNAVETTQSGALKTFEFRDGSIISLLDETVPVFNGKALDSVYTSDVQDVFGAEIADIAKRAKDMGVPGTLEELTDDVTTVLSQLGQGLGSKRDMSVAVESLAPSGQGAPSRFKTIYNHFIEPKSTIETTSTVTELGSKKGKMYKVGLEPKPEDMLDYQGTFADQPKNVQDWRIKGDWI